MVDKSTRHLFLGYNTIYEDTRINTIEEHIDIDKTKGEVIWGQFTKHPNQHRFEQAKIKVLDTQVKSNIPTYVFFCSDKYEEQNELYCAEYIDQYGRKDIGDDIIDLVPKYYHDRVNTDPECDKFTCKSYVRVKNIRKISTKELENMYQFQEPYYSVQKIRDNTTQRPKPVLYINLGTKLYNKLCKAGEL